MVSLTDAAAPGHVCIIMDGNGRWARKRVLPRSMGHRKGVEIARQAVEFFARAGVGHLTLFAFSSENWQRPDDEVDSLMELFLRSLEKYTDELHERDVRIRFIGNRDSFSAALRQQIELAESKTRANTRMTLNIAANYGGHGDIVDACKRLARRCQRGEMDSADIDTTSLAAELSLGDTPDPDLFIRTGGEQRISNFLLWQLAYTELYFCETLWPDFGEREMQAALDEYAQRQRRYGRTAEQIEARR